MSVFYTLLNIILQSFFMVTPCINSKITLLYNKCTRLY